jgi:hypothetical protein
MRTLDAPSGGVVLNTFSNELHYSFSGADREMMTETLAIGNIEVGSGINIPLFLEAYFGGNIDPLRVAYGRVLLPYAVVCNDILGKTFSIEARRRLHDALQYHPFLSGRG